MRSPIRRSRNIGTARQGHGQNNRLVIPWPTAHKAFYERLGPTTRQDAVINGQVFSFLTETPRAGWQHCCSVADIAHLIEHIPPEYYGELRLIVLRQPKRKEAILSPVWGRLLYAYEFAGEHFPAIVLEAVNLQRPLRWSRYLSVDDQQELRRLAADGHRLEQTPRQHLIWLQPHAVRHTQLYRTLLHEFGHYQHYRQLVEQPDQPDEEPSAWETRYEHYFRLPTAEKERYAHAFAARLAQRLEAAGIIPFNSLP